MVRGILFDLDGTLFDRDAAVLELVTEQHRLFGTALTCIPRDTFVARVLELDAHGHGDKTALYQQIVDDFGLPAGLATSLTAQFWKAYHAFCRGFPETQSVLTQLAARGFRLGIITNGTIQIQEPVIRRLGLDALVKTVLISEREGIRKPDRRIFERALNVLDLRADETWYCGDHPVIDVQAAVEVGLAAIWRRTRYWPKPQVPHREIGSLDELLSMAEPRV